MIDDLKELRVPGLNKQSRVGRPSGLILKHYIRVRASDLTREAIKYLGEVSGGVSASDIVRQAVMEYIRKQREHHAAGKIVERLERVNEPEDG